VSLAVESRGGVVAVFVGLFTGAIQVLITLHDPYGDQTMDHHVVKVRSPSGLRVMPIERDIAYELPDLMEIVFDDLSVTFDEGRILHRARAR
jgi:hypothetical protein